MFLFFFRILDNMIIWKLWLRVQVLLVHIGTHQVVIRKILLFQNHRLSLSLNKHKRKEKNLYLVLFYSHSLLLVFVIAVNRIQLNVYRVGVVVVAVFLCVYWKIGATKIYISFIHSFQVPVIFFIHSFICFSCSL